jgi:hypothetical protein
MSYQTDFCSSCGKEMFEGARFCTYCGAKNPATSFPTTKEDPSKVFEVRKIGICSLAKFAFMINAIIGLALGILFSSIGMTDIGSVGFLMQMQGLQLMGPGLWIGFALGFSIVYGLIGAIIGAIFGILYNILAWGVGGIKITLEGSG